MIAFSVPGDPYGKQRPRQGKNFKGEKVFYSPEENREYEDLVKLCYKTSKSKEKFFNKEPLVMTLIVYYSIPKSTTKKDREKMLNGELYPTKKPDWDNIGKAVADALNGIAYKDDAQIVRGFVFKEYTDGKPYVRVKIRKMTTEDRIKAQ